MLIAILVLLVLIVLWGVLTRNRFVRLQNAIEEAFAAMDVAFKKRWDLIPNLIGSVKGYIAHEEKTLTELARIRTAPYESLSESAKIPTNEALTHAVRNLFALAESYPELKSSENFRQLSKETASVEDEIALSRRYYNAVLKDYNNAIRMFPSNLIAAMMRLEKKAMLEITEDERQPVTIAF